MYDQYLAMIMQFAGNFSPVQFQLCNGQILAIPSNTALFSLLGTNYGGNGTSSFGLPDLRGRTPVGQGLGPGLSQYFIGEMTGMESVTLHTNNIPLHNHTFNNVAGTGTQGTISGALLAEGPKKGQGPTAKAPNLYLNGVMPNTPLNTLSVGVNVNGGSLPMSVMQPFLPVTYIIATAGIFPQRN